MAYSTSEFFAVIKPMVLKDMAETDILASLTAAQAKLESNSGNSGLTQKANNLFGMKGSYNGQSVTMPTKEWSKERGYYTINAAFKKYPSWVESIADHSSLFNRAKRYANLRGERDYKTACQKVHQDGYATAYNYAAKLIAVVESNRLYEWDREVISFAKNPQTESVQEPVNGNPYAEPTKNVRFGTKGNDARWLQVELNRRGYHLIVDGVIGQKSIEALKNYQYMAGLSVDGICGAVTRKSLLVA